MDPPIIITGGSVTIELDESLLHPLGNGRFANGSKKIKQVLIEGDYDRDTGLVKDGKVKITVLYGNATP